MIEGLIATMKINRPIKSIFLAVLFLLSFDVLSAQTKVSTLKFSTFNNLVFLKAKLNNSANLTFILDTGASGCVLSEKTSKNLGPTLRLAQRNPRGRTGVESKFMGGTNYTARQARGLPRSARTLTPRPRRQLRIARTSVEQRGRAGHVGE